MNKYLKLKKKFGQQIKPRTKFFIFLRVNLSFFILLNM